MVMTVQLSRSLRPATGTMYISSSTLPSLIMSILEDLDVADGHQVLEIGTGSGYSAALLCERLGSANVTSVDIDPELVDLAGERLAANGRSPNLATVDGVGGNPECAPYDRIVSTCAVPAVPASWLAQAAPGAVILTDVRGPLGGTLVRLTVDEWGTATGRFVPRWAGFMEMRHEVTPVAEPYTWYALTASESWTSVDPTAVNNHGLFGFVVQWRPPGVTQGRSIDADGQPTVFLIDRAGNRAEVLTTETPQGYRVRQYGDRRLWDRVEEAAAFWNDEGPLLRALRHQSDRGGPVRLVRRSRWSASLAAGRRSRSPSLTSPGAALPRRRRSTRPSRSAETALATVGPWPSSTSATER
jgi:protein-L-isoaspartate O-methyltransferase